MKIAFLVGKFPSLSQTFILNQVTGLIDRGHEVDIYALNGPMLDSSERHPAVEQYHLLNRTYSSPGLPYSLLRQVIKGLVLLLANIHRGSLSCLPLLFTEYRRQSYSLKLFYKVMPLLGNGPYDIIHCQFGPFGEIGLIFRNLGLLQGKLITTFRGIDISQDIQKYGEHLYEQLFVEGDFFLTNCEYFRHRAIKLGCDQDKILVHGSGIDCRKFTFTPRSFPSDGQVRIVTTGRLIEKKGIEYSIRAIAKLVHGDHPYKDSSEHRYTLEYNIIGDGALKQCLLNLIEELNVDHIIRLLGWKQQQELITILNGSHIFIAPSITAANGNQDAPVNTLKEAMAMGLPVISTYHGGIPELVEDGISGLLVPERDADAIAEKLSYLIEHPEIWSKMSQAGRTRVEEKYDMEKLNDELVEIYQKLLNPEVSIQ